MRKVRGEFARNVNENSLTAAEITAMHVQNAGIHGGRRVTLPSAILQSLSAMYSTSANMYSTWTKNVLNFVQLTNSDGWRGRKDSNRQPSAPKPAVQG
jgi:hypothetical protein